MRSNINPKIFLGIFFLIIVDKGHVNKQTHNLFFVLIKWILYKKYNRSSFYYKQKKYFFN